MNAAEHTRLDGCAPPYLSSSAPLLVARTAWAQKEHLIQTVTPPTPHNLTKLCIFVGAPLGNAGKTSKLKKPRMKKSVFAQQRAQKIDLASFYLRWGAFWCNSGGTVSAAELSELVDLTSALIGFLRICPNQATKKAQSLTLRVRRPPGGVGVFHVKRWWSKSSCPPSKVCLNPRVLKGGIWGGPGILPGCSGPLGVFKKFVPKRR